MNLNLKRVSAYVRDSLSWSHIKEMRYVIAAFWPLYILFSWLLGNWLLGGALAGIAVPAAREIHARYGRALVARIDAADSPTWDVEVNQVKAGTITDADYAAIRLRVFYDFRTYAAQVVNLFRVALNSFDYCYRAIPLGLFWVGVALAIFSPETISSVLAALQHATPSDMRHAVVTAGSLLAILMIVSVGFHWMLGLSRFGFINRFDEATGTAVRKHCGVVAEGSIMLVRWADGSPVVSDEMAFVRRKR